jgi:WD40 repeat protein
LSEAERTTTAQRQQAEPAKLTSLLRGDLDWIVLKALEKDRARRYATANGLAQDIRRYLDNEPILARPPSATYRFQKLVRRNKLVFAGAGAVAMALVIGLAFSTWQFIEKSAAYRRAVNAEQEQSRLRHEAEAARRSAELQALAARRQAYAADMSLAQQALAVNNLGRAQELLNRHRPSGESQSSDFKTQSPADLRGWEWRYLWQHCQSDALFTLSQLSNEVSALSVSHDGKWVAIGEYGDKGMSIWDLRARQEIARFPAGEGSEQLAFSPVAPVLAFYVMDRPDRLGPANWRGHVRFWDVVTRRIVGDLPISGSCRAVTFSADGTRLLTASGDTEFTIWDVAQGTKFASVTVSESKVSEGRPPYGDRVTVNRDLTLAAQAIGGGRIRLLDVASGKVLWTEQAADEEVTALAFSPNGKHLASGAGFVESAVRLWEVASGREVARLEGHRTFVRSLLFWPDGETLASASGDQTIHLWDVGSLDLVPARPARSSADSTRPDYQPQRRQPRPRVVELHPDSTLRGHRLEVWSLALCPDNTTLVSGSKDGSVCVWDTANLQRNQSCVTLPVPVRAWSFAPDGQAILALNEQGRVVRWHGPDFQQSQTLLELGTNSFITCFSADGRFMATASSKGMIQVWALQEGALLREIASEKERELPVAFLAQSNHLVTQQGRGGRFCEWDVTTGREIRRWRLTAPGLAWKRAFSPDDQWCVALDGEGTAQLHRLVTGQDMRLDLRLTQVSGVAFSPDGRLLAAVSVLGSGQLWDLQMGQQVTTLRGFLQGTHSVTFSPDGQRLAIGSNGNEAIKLWDIESLQELLTLKGQGSMFNSTAFSPDGNVLASSNGEGLLHIWRAPSFDEIVRLEAKGR